MSNLPSSSITRTRNSHRQRLVVSTTTSGTDRSLRVSAKHLQEYLDKFSFRYTHRRGKHLLFNAVLANCEA
jgi:hypothetical protein